jgi:hypothetical protein
MSEQLKVGDRVRVSHHNHVQGYQPGDKGMVQGVPDMPVMGDHFHYLVAMDKDGGSSRTVFTAEEIELDTESPDRRQTMGQANASPEEDAEAEGGME